jgi:hypothetical protein
MPPITLNPGYPAYTIPANGKLTAIKATGPGQDGQGPQVTFGSGGASIDPIDFAGVGADATNLAGAVAGAGQCYLNNVAHAAGTFAVADGDEIIIVGGGGASSSTAGGASGSLLDFSVPAGGHCNITVVIGSAGQNSTINRSGASGAQATKGGDASGDTPGVHGAFIAGVDWDDWIQGSIDGNDGTAPTFTGGNGGPGGNWATPNDGGGVVVNAGDTVTLNNADVTSLSLATPLIDGFILIAVPFYSGGFGASTDLPGGIAQENIGGLGGNASGSNLGASGGTAATELASGVDGTDNITGEDLNGADGVNPGDGGNGAGAFGSTGGAGKPGFASFVFTADPPPVASGRASALFFGL